MTASSNGRWWEGYLVRYMVPAITGMAVLAILFNGPACYLKEILFFGYDFDKFETGAFILFFLYGTLFCYVASYPILLFHGTRVLDIKDDKCSCNNPVSPYWLSIAVLASAFLLAVFKPIDFAPLVLVCIFSVFQGCRIYRSLKKSNLSNNGNNSAAYEYMDKLSRERANDGNVNKEIVESYRHLREHGNSAFILVLEITLGLLVYCVLADSNKVLLGFDKNWMLTALIAVWVGPSVFIHMIGQRLESEFSGYK